MISASLVKGKPDGKMKEKTYNFGNDAKSIIAEITESPKVKEVSMI